MWFLIEGVRKYARAVLLGCALGSAAPASAADFNAGRVLFEMEEVERFSFLAGMTEGFAYARYKMDGNTSDGMNCIYKWFYDDEKAYDNILAAFAKFQERTPGAIMAALIERKCGA